MSPTAVATSSDARDQVTTAELMVQAAVKKHAEPMAIQFYKAFNAGALLSFGGCLSLQMGASPEEQMDNPGLIKLLSAMVFPVGLIMLVLLGQELCTGTMMSVLMAALKRKVPCYLVTLHFFGNLCGSLAVAAFLAHWSEIFATPPYYTWVLTFANTKVNVPQAQNIILRGIGCNTLVCIAVWLSVQARETFSKVLVLWFPIFVFVGCGFDHVVANMLFIPLALMLGSPVIDTDLYIRKSLLPSLLGNFIGAWLIAIPFTVMYLTSYGGALPIRDSGAAQQHTPSDEEATVYNGNGNGTAKLSEKMAFWRGEKRAGSTTVAPVTE